MKTSKRVLSLLMAVAMLCSLIVFSSAEPPTPAELGPGNHSNEPDDLSGGKFQIVGQTTVVSHSTLSGNPDIKVTFDIYMDPSEYIGLNSVSLRYSYDSDYLTLVTPLGTLKDRDGYPATGYVANGLGISDTVISFMRNPVATDNFIAADGFVCQVEYTFKAKEAFAGIDPSVGTLVNMWVFASSSDGFEDVYGWKVVDGAAKMVEIDSKVLATKNAQVTYVSSMLTYDVGAGVRSTENGGMDAFKPAPFAPGAPINIADGAGLVIPAGGGNVAKAFDHWVDQDEVTRPAGPSAMSDGGIALKAVYSDDANEDGIPDNKQMKVTYTRRSGDEGILTVPTGATANGKFITEGANKVIYVTSGDTIGDSFATLDLTAPALDDWDFIGYFIGSTEYDEAALSAMTVTAPITIELRAMLDTNDNGIDDRDTVTLTFLEPDGVTEVGSIDVLDRTPYTVYSDPDKNTPADSGEAGESGDPTEVTLPVVPGTIPGGKHTGWSIEPILGPGDKVIGVEVVPVYSEDQQVEIPDLRDPDDPELPLEPPIVELNTGAVLIHRGVNNQPIGTPITIGSTEEIQLIAHPIVGDYANLPARYNNKPFAGWILTGPVAAANPQNPDIYYLDPYYASPIDFTITDPKKESDLTDDVILDGFDEKEVPADSTYEILDEEGNVLDSGIIADEGGEITLPFTEDLPERNGDGDIFTGDWTVSEEKNNDGSTNYVIAPEYAAPTGDDIIIAVDEDEDANGHGLSVLQGFFENDTTAEATFYVQIAGGAATAADANRLKVNMNAVFGFNDLVRPQIVVGNLSTISYEGTDDIDGDEYGVFKVTYTTIKSGIVKLSLSYGNNAADANAPGYVVVTVADVTKDGRVNTADATEKLKVGSEISDTPLKGEAGAYLYELCDVTMDNRINTADFTTSLKMASELILSN